MRNNRNNKPPTREEVLAALAYDPVTGSFARLSMKKKVGNINAQGYLAVNVNGSVWGAHRLAWLIMTGEWPAHQIDHVNHNKLDNRFCNLREVTHGENAKNLPKRADNSSGITGVSFNNQSGLWRAAIKVDGKSKHLCLHWCKDTAALHRWEAEKQLGFHHNHGKPA